MESRKQYLRQQIVERSVRIEEAIPAFVSAISRGTKVVGSKVAQVAKSLASRGKNLIKKKEGLVPDELPDKLSDKKKLAKKIKSRVKSRRDTQDMTTTTEDPKNSEEDLDFSHTVYKKLGYAIAESLLGEDWDVGMDPPKKGSKPKTPSKDNNGEKTSDPDTQDDPKPTRSRSEYRAKKDSKPGSILSRLVNRGTKSEYSTTPGQEPDDKEKSKVQDTIRRAERDERTAQAASRGTSRPKVRYRTIKNPDGSETVQSIKQGTFNRANYTRTGPDDTRRAAITRGLAGTLPARQLRGRVQRVADRGVMRTAAGAARSGLARFRSARASGKKPENIDYSHTEYQRIGSIIAEKSAAWTRKAGKNPSGGLNAKGVASYRAKNPGSKLKTAVTTKPSKLKKGSKAAKRRSSFCSRMSGMRKRQNPKNNTGKDRLSLSLKKWNC